MWAASTLSKVLHNEVIAGRQRDGHGHTVLKVEPIVPREIWDAVIARLAVRTKRQGISQSKAPALLTSIIMCSLCNKPMYRTGPAYYCRVKGCRSRILIDVADAYVHDAMSIDDRRDVIEVIVPGTGHDAEIAETKRDIADATQSEAWEKLDGLRAELDRLRALPSSPTRVERRESALTVAEMWAAMPDDAARRGYLMERRARVEYGRDEQGAGTLIGTLGQSQH